MPVDHALSTSRAISSSPLTKGLAVHGFLGACMCWGTWSSVGRVQAGPPDSVATLAQREAAKRTANVQEAKALMAEAALLYDKGEYDESLRRYKEAFDLLPDAPFTAQLRQQARDGFARAADAQAKKLADQGRYGEARALLNQVVQEPFSPDDAQAHRLLKELDDPERYNPAITPEHIREVSEVKRLLQMAQGYFELADYDSADAAYQEVLRHDPYNKTARAGMERAEKQRSQYYDVARNHTRAKMLGQVDAAWENPVPRVDLSGMFGGSSESSLSKDSVISKLNSIIIPRVDFQGATLDEAVEFLRIRARELDPSKRGISFVVKVPAAVQQKAITLNVQQVPVAELLRYITEITGTAYRVDEYAVIITSQSEKTETMITKIFPVPPNFIQNAPVDQNVGADANNPFAARPQGAQAGALPTAPGDTSPRMTRLGAKEFLQSQGVPFPGEATASFIASSGMLMVHNTPQNMALVENLIDQAKNSSPRQVEIQVRLIKISETRLTELGFDWLMGQFNLPGSGSVFGSGGTAAANAADYPFLYGGGAPGASSSTSTSTGSTTPGTPVGGYSLTSGLRSSGPIVGAPTIDSLIQGQQTPSTTSKTPGVFAVSGVFTDPQFQTVIRALDQKKGVDLVAVPTVVTKAGQRARILVARELRYPTEFNPPQIPTTASGSNTPVTPTTPTAFEKRDVGIALEVEPVISADNTTVDVNLAPLSTEFEGFINYGTPINIPVTSFTGVTTRAVPNPIVQPVFITNKVNTSVTVWDGSTVVLGGVTSDNRTDIEDKVPVLGDLPLVGRAFQSKVTQTQKQVVLFFVTVRIIDPGGNSLHPRVRGAATATAAR